MLFLHKIRYKTVSLACYLASVVTGYDIRIC